MKILHSADLHLRENDDNTIDGLEALLNTAHQENVDFLTLGGDLFDSPEDAETLRPRLRDMLQDNPFEIVAIPGNHDEDSFRDNIRFGNDLRILTDKPFESRKYGDVEVIGVPYVDSMNADLFSALQDHSADHTQILLLHCTLDIGFQSDATGADEGTYFPVTKATLADLDYEYVLAGHIHSNDRVVPLDNGGVFIYPGSPVSHASSETGRRHAVLIDTDTNDIDSVELETFYYDIFEETIQPGEEEEVLGRLREWIARQDAARSDLSVIIDGYTQWDEDRFYDQLVDAAGHLTPTDNTRGVNQVLNHPLYSRFESRLEERSDIDDPEVIKKRVIDVLSRLLARNEVKPQ